MKSIQSLSIKYTVYLTLCLFANFYIVVLSSLNIPEYIPYTPIKIYGLIIFLFSLTVFNLFIKELIKARQELAIGYLTLYASAIYFYSEIVFQSYLFYLFPQDGWASCIIGTCSTSAFFAFVAFQLKTRRTKRLILFIVILMIFIKTLMLIFPNIFSASNQWKSGIWW